MPEHQQIIVNQWSSIKLTHNVLVARGTRGRLAIPSVDRTGCSAWAASLSRLPCRTSVGSRMITWQMNTVLYLYNSPTKMVVKSIKSSTINTDNYANCNYTPLHNQHTQTNTREDGVLENILTNGDARLLITTNDTIIYSASIWYEDERAGRKIRYRPNARSTTINVSFWCISGFITECHANY